MRAASKEIIFKDKIVSSVIETIDCFNMLSTGDRVLISISGGPDSTFLAYVLHHLKPVLNLTLFGFHLDHMTRDSESGRDAVFVEDLCRRLDVELVKKKVDVKKWCRINKMTFQDGARKIRTKMLLETSKRCNADKIAVGHNADDNIETFLMHLIRGAGVRGLAGIKPAGGKFIRPLINTNREDIEEFLKKNNISYCIDRTNIESIYFRNKVRNILIPFIRENFLKAFKKNILKSIKLLRDEDDFIRDLAENKLDQIAYFKKNFNGKGTAVVKIPIKELVSLSDAIKRRVILCSIEKIKGDLENISFRNIEDILKISIIGGESKSIFVSEKVKAGKECEYIYIFDVDSIGNLSDGLQWLVKHEDEKDRDMEEVEKQVEIGKRKKYKEFNIELFSEILDINSIGKKSSNFRRISNTGSMEVLLDYDRIKFPVKIRRWKKGDRFYPLGMHKEKKLHDFFIDCKIPRHFRKSVPIFQDEEKIIWVGGCRIDDRAKISSSTAKILSLKLFNSKA